MYITPFSYSLEQLCCYEVHSIKYQCALHFFFFCFSLVVYITALHLMWIAKIIFNVFFSKLYLASDSLDITNCSLNIRLAFYSPRHIYHSYFALKTGSTLVSLFKVFTIKFADSQLCHLLLYCQVHLRSTSHFSFSYFGQKSSGFLTSSSYIW